MLSDQAVGEKNSHAERLLKHGHMLAKVDSEKVRIYVSDYIDAFRLDTFYDSDYAKEARLLLD